MPLLDGRDYIPTIQIRDGCAILYNLPGFVRDGKKSKEFKKKAYSSVVTKGMQKRVASAIDIFLQTTDMRQVYNTVTGRTMDFRCGFMTMTISDLCDWKADVCYSKLLRPFMRVMKEKHNVQKYIWKYELQKRGNVHYHVLLDQFIPYDRVTMAWNKLQRKHGLSDKYAEKHGHFNPNSTDIHKVWQIQNIGAYLGKYLQKGNSGAKGENDTKGKVWDCSTDLKRRRFTTTFDWENNDRLMELMDMNEAKVMHLENCTVVRCPHVEKLLTEDQNIDYCVWRYGI